MQHVVSHQHDKQQFKLLLTVLSYRGKLQ